MKTSKERIVEWIRNEFGLEDGVKFNLVDVKGDKRGWAPFYFENNKLRGVHRSLIHEDIFLNWDNIEVIPEPLLTDDEREYLQSIVKFSLFHITHLGITETSIGKYPICQCNTEEGPRWYESWYSNLDFKGLEFDKWYSLEELGLL